MGSALKFAASNILRPKGSPGLFGSQKYGKSHGNQVISDFDAFSYAHEYLNPFGDERFISISHLRPIANFFDLAATTGNFYQPNFINLTP
jgi:hypothetical protein